MKKRKYIALIIVCVFLLTVIMPSVYANYNMPSYFRIGLFFGTSAKNEANVTSENGFKLGRYEGTEFLETKKTSETELNVKFDGSSIIASSNGKTIYKADAADGMGIFPTKGGLDRRITIDGEEYRGGLDFKTVNGKNVIVNVVFADNYIYGVISREMSPSWHKEALKAQAVCARNFACHNLGKHANYGFDLCNSVCCQSYSGTRFETENTYAPVDETSNQVLTYNGELAELYYFASAGDRTEACVNVWGNDVPYLVSVDNSFEDTANSPNGVWVGSITCDEATTILRNKGYNVGDVKSIKVLEYSESGRALKMEVKGTTGSVIFEREACRTIFNSVTKSQQFTVKGNGEASQNVPVIRSTDGTNVSEKKINEVVILSSDGRGTLSGDKMLVSNGVFRQSYEVTQSAETSNTGFVFEGVGWGHGVGMSQYGAKGMAEKGYSYVDILLHYFPGTNLENAY